MTYPRPESRKPDNSRLFEQWQDLLSRFEERLAELEPAVQEYRRIETLVSDMKSRAENNDWTMDFDRREESARIVLRKPPGKRKAEILELLRREPGMQVTEIGHKLGLTPSRVSQITRAMISDGQLVRTDFGLEVPE